METGEKLPEIVGRDIDQRGKSRRQTRQRITPRPQRQVEPERLERRLSRSSADAAPFQLFSLVLLTLAAATMTLNVIGGAIALGVTTLVLALVGYFYYEH